MTGLTLTLASETTRRRPPTNKTLSKPREKSKMSPREIRSESGESLASDRLEREVKRVLDQEIDFVDNVEFRHADAELEILGPDRQLLTDPAARKRSPLPRDLPAHLAALCQTELLTADEERRLFRAMNYLKFRANALRAALDPAHPCSERLQSFQASLQAAEALRDRLILANMRLVVSIVKNFIGPTHSFDDMLSEGVVSLMQAVDKFDYDRGFRFSTYAYRAICRNSLRMITQQKKEAARYSVGGAEQLFEVPGHGDCSSVAEHRWSRLREAMTQMLTRLDRRERFIIRGRYALGSHRKVRTFQCLADKLGVSKERVRQLEQRAVLKLQQMAEEAGLDELRESLWASAT